MVDLQRVFVDDDALDHQPQDGLPLGNAGGLQSFTDTFTERGQAGHGFLGLEPLLVQPSMLFISLFNRMALVGEEPTLFGQFRKADHLGLVGLQKTPISPLQSLHADPQLLAGQSLPGVDRRALRDKVLELGQQLGRIAEQSDNVIPDCLLDAIRADHGAGAFGFPSCRQAIDAGTTVVAQPRPAALRREAASVQAKSAGAALQ